MSMKGHDCPVCKRERYYKSKAGLAKSETSVCQSCANSIKMGGEGWSIYCIDCKTNLRDPKYNSQCKDCHNKRSKSYYKSIGRWSKYGLDQPIEMSECEICKTKDDLVIDHCHTTKEVRGILCRTCNMALGLFKDNKKNLRSAIEYAERTFRI